MKYIPHDYQDYAIRKVLEQNKIGLLLDMGLGKTAITLTALSQLLALGDVHKVLVIAPLQTARNTWQDECAKWEHLGHLRLSHVLGTAKERRDALEANADIYIINRENTQWICEECKAWPFDALVVDELSSFKNPSAKRFKALRKMLPFCHRVIGLTGTPAPNGYMDLWSEIYLLDRGERLGRTLGSYRDLYFKPGRRNGYTVYEWKMRDGAKAQIDDKLTDLCISMKSVDHLSMPEKVETELFVQMSKEEKEIYDQFGRDHVLPEKDVVGLSSAAVQNKLLQMANGFVYNEDKEVFKIHDHKLERLQELVDSAGEDNPILVYYSFLADKEAILKQFPQARELKGRQEVSDWNARRIPMLVAHPASAGHGLNLQSGGNIIVWYGLPWSLELFQQANARLYRQGQTKTVCIYYILTKDTHDLDVLEALRRKDVTQEALLKALKARLEKWKR